MDIRQHASTILDMLQERLPYLPDEVVEVAASVLGRRRQILDRFVPLNGDFPTQRIRIHGDYLSRLCWSQELCSAPGVFDPSGALGAAVGTIGCRGILTRILSNRAKVQLLCRPGISISATS